MRWEQTVVLVRWRRIGTWDKTWDFCEILGVQIKPQRGHIAQLRFGHVTNSVNSIEEVDGS
jgi:hypothetical protein